MFKILFFILLNFVVWSQEQQVKEKLYDYRPVDGLSSIEPQIFWNGSRSIKKIALTIDDGWVEDDALLSLLSSYNIKCTVFIIGKIAEKRPDFISKLDKMGFDIANHGYSHSNLTTMSDEEIEKDLRLGQAAITKITGKTVPLFRPPGGQIDSRAWRIIAKLGYRLILWDNDLLGYKFDSSIESQLEYVRKHLNSGNIILSHFGPKLKTAEVLKIMIPEILKQGYSFVTVSELLF